MALPSIPDPPGVGDLTKAARIRYLEALWDRIADQPGELPSEPWHSQRSGAPGTGTTPGGLNEPPTQHQGRKAPTVGRMIRLGRAPA